MGGSHKIPYHTTLLTPYPPYAIRSSSKFRNPQNSTKNITYITKRYYELSCAANRSFARIRGTQARLNTKPAIRTISTLPCYRIIRYIPSLSSCDSTKLNYNYSFDCCQLKQGSTEVSRINHLHLTKEKWLSDGILPAKSIPPRRSSSPNHRVPKI